MSRSRALLRRLRPSRGRESVPAPVDRLAATTTETEREILHRTAPYTLTGQERQLAVIDAVRHCTRRQIPGAFVECGVWRGGSVLAVLLTLLEAGVHDRELYLYDTFEMMTEPSDLDTSPFDRPALETWREAAERGERAWSEYFDPATFNESSVRELLQSTAYPAGRMQFVKGRVQDTIPGTMPDQIALLRLDTDWYESTRHELEHLYPRLAPGGVLIIDDYGHWEGARRAVDEYFETHPALLMARIDYTCRMAVKI